MARLSSPESALEKIDGMYRKIDELYETVDLINRLNGKFNLSFDEIAKDESLIKTKIENFDALEVEYGETIKKLEETGERSKLEIDRIVEEFEKEKQRIDETVERLLAERRDVEKIRQAMDEEAERTKNAIESKTEYFSNLSETAISNCQAMITQAVREGKDILDKALSDSKNDLVSFKESMEGAVSFRMETFHGETEEFKASAHREIQTGFKEETDRFRETSENRMEEIDAEFLRIKERFEETMEKLGAERLEIDEKRGELAEEMARINREFGDGKEDFAARLEVLIKDSENKLDRAVEDGNEIIREQVNHLSAFIDGAEKDMQNLKGDLNVFKDRLNSDVNSEVEELFKQNTAFQENAGRDLNAKFSEEAKRLETMAEKEIENIMTEFNREKVKANETLQSLRSEKKDIEGMRQVLDDEMSQFNRKISGKTTHFTDQLKKLFINSQRRINQGSEQANRRIDEKLIEFAAIMDESKKTIRSFEEDLNVQKENIDGHLNRKSDELSAKYTEFEEALAKKSAETIREESKKNGEEMENRLAGRMDEYMARQKTLVDNLIQQIDSFERRVSVLKTEREDEGREQKEKDAKIAGWMEKLARRQKDYKNILPIIDKRIKSVESRFSKLLENTSLMQKNQTRQQSAIPNLEKRIRAIENKIEEMSAKKGLFSFSKQGGK